MAEVNDAWIHILVAAGAVVAGGVTGVLAVWAYVRLTGDDE